MTGIRVAVVDDHPLFREGVTRSLAELGFSIVAEGSTSEDALKVAGEVRPDILLMDISMPGGGLRALDAIFAANPQQKVVMLTVSEAGEDVTAALNSGAKGYVLKGVGARSLAEILTTVAGGDSYVSPTLSARLLSAFADQRKGSAMGDLTEREQEILALVAEGLSNKRVALKLDLHEKTIKHHMTRILAKLQLTNRTEAALAFRKAMDSR